MLHEINQRSSKRDEMIDITGQVQRIVTQAGIREGWAVVYAAHTTAGITINENADPDVVRDLLRRLDELCPWHMAADRHGEGNSAAHLKASMVGAAQTVIISNGRLLLGTWQGIYFCEFDGPRSRTCYVKILPERMLEQRAKILEAELSRLSGEQTYSVDEVRKRLQENYSHA